MVFRCWKTYRLKRTSASSASLYFTLPVSLSPSSNQKFIYRPYGYDLLGAEWLHCLPAKCLHLECFWLSDSAAAERRLEVPEASQFHSSANIKSTKRIHRQVSSSRYTHIWTCIRINTDTNMQSYRVYLQIDIDIHVYILPQCVWLMPAHTGLSDWWTIIEN